MCEIHFSFFNHGLSLHFHAHSAESDDNRTRDVVTGMLGGGVDPIHILYINLHTKIRPSAD